MLRSSAESLKKRFFEKLGYWPDPENPKTLPEKLLWRKLYEDMSEAVRLADKAAVRDYVRDVIGERYLIDSLAIVDDANDLDFDALPQSFVLKINRTSSTNMVVEDKSKLDIDAIRRILNSVMRFEYGRRWGEHWYSAMPAKLIAERLLVDREHGVPVDYRFHVFHGKAEFIQTASQKQFSEDRIPGVPSVGQKYVDNAHTVVGTYDMEWRPAPFKTEYYPPSRDRVPTVPLEKTPSAAAEMVALAETLAGDWGYVRVDLYCLNDTEVYFGELTFTHDSGMFFVEPEPYGEYLGGLWDIGRRYVRSERPPMPLFT
jgi:hypothetical protein